MNKMSDLFLQIRNELESDRAPNIIAQVLNIPREWVYEALDQIQTEDKSPAGDYPSEAEIDAMADYYANKEENCEFDHR